MRSELIRIDYELIEWLKIKFEKKIEEELKQKPSVRFIVEYGLRQLKANIEDEVYVLEDSKIENYQKISKWKKIKKQM